jgi:hypothetical protein
MECPAKTGKTGGEAQGSKPQGLRHPQAIARREPVLSSILGGGTEQQRLGSFPEGAIYDRTLGHATLRQELSTPGFTATEQHSISRFQGSPVHPDQRTPGALGVQTVPAVVPLLGVHVIHARSHGWL